MAGDKAGRFTCFWWNYIYKLWGPRYKRKGEKKREKGVGRELRKGG